MTRDPKTIALEYIDASGRKDFEAVAPLLAPDLEVVGVFKTIRGADAYVTVLRSLAPIWVRNDVRNAIAEGDHACVLYDFVTDTPAGAFACTEWVQVEDGRIRRIRLLFDGLAFLPVKEELERRAVRGAERPARGSPGAEMGGDAS